jgi:peptide/nickel transport system substrate-binding protein
MVSTPDQNKRLPYDPKPPRSCWPTPAIPSGFEVDELPERPLRQRRGDICQAVAANLARIGVKINLEAETKGTYFPKILRRDTSFYMLGWTPDHV